MTWSFNLDDGGAAVGDDLGALADFDRRHIVHPWAVQDEYVSTLAARAEGMHVWDADGRRYLDFTSQSWFANVGHGDSRIVAAIGHQAAELATVYGWGTKPKLELAERLLGLLPPGYGRVFFGLNGSDAVEAALKIARLVTGRQNVLAFWYGYHGASMGATSVTGVPRWRVGVGEPVPGTFFVDPPYHYRAIRAGESQADTDRLTVEQIRRAIEQIGPSTIAALISEPIQATGGGIVPGPGYWRDVRKLCDQYDILLIGDEVVTGFGRVGYWFARDYYDYEPDIILLAKGLTSGYLPLSAAIFRQELAERFAGLLFPHGLTFSGHPVCCAAASANIDVIEQDGLIGRARELGEHLQRVVRELAAHPSVGDVRGLGLFAAIELVRNRRTREPFPPEVELIAGGGHGDIALQIAGRMRERGVLVHALRVQGIVKLAPPLIVTPEQIDEVAAHLDELLTQLDRWVVE